LEKKIVIPKLQQQFSFPSIIHKTILTASIGESFLAKKIATIEDSLPSHIKLAYLPSVGAVRLRLSAYGNDNRVLAEELNTIVDSLYACIGEYIYGEEEDTLSHSVGKLLAAKNNTVATAESCTGGYLAHLLTSIPGSSSYYTGSILAYANVIKENILQVDKNILIQNGAVSEACVKAMAENCRRIMHTDYAIATSGVAGPSGGTKEKPVGTVWIAVATPTHCIARVFNMGDHRGRTIERTALMGLDMLRKELIAAK